MASGIFIIQSFVERVGDRDLSTCVEAVEYCTMNDTSEPYQFLWSNSIPDFPSDTVEQLTPTKG